MCVRILVWSPSCWQGKLTWTRSRRPATILTTTPNQFPADIHGRMPAILAPENYDLWLDPGSRDVGATTEMLRPFDAG
jgi:putative SOS response-associated peptidase YedK